MKYINRIIDIYKKESNNFINENSIHGVALVGFYMFYHYYNADVTRLDELNNNFCFLTGEDSEVIAINNSYYEDNGIDFIFTSTIYDDKQNVDDYLKNYLTAITDKVANIICGNTDELNNLAIEKLSEYERNDNTIYNVILICNYLVEMNKKIEYQNLFNNKSVKNGRVRFSIIFKDELEEELSDVESPKNCVSKGTLKLTNVNVSFFGNEHSFLGFISAISLKKMYYSYSTHGLFASNLRYYVKSAKIDSQIVNTILNEPENFCYYNNGIIITCDDYIIKDGELELYNFSIVNGGQTTNLIGRTNFDNDFPIMCKVIKNKYASNLDKAEFLSKVAEASNTQKPIKVKDLIANKKEQRALKMQFENIGVFLQTKRGDKISKEKYNKPWQNATNDHVAQMLYSSVFQSPGSAKNSKSKLLENDKTYNKIFKNSYNSNYLLSLQHLKVAYNNWVKSLKKEEKKSSTLLGLAKNCDLMMLGVLGLIYKYYTNDGLKERLNIIDLKYLNYENDTLRTILSQNDIGTLSFLSDEVVLGLVENVFSTFFEELFEIFIKPAYDKFKKDYNNYSYSHFVKSDYYYYNYLIPHAIKILKNKLVTNYILNILNLTNKTNLSVDYEDIFKNFKPGLEEELKEYRTGIYKGSNGRVPAYNVFNNNQLVNLVKYMPKTLSELKTKAKLREQQIIDYGSALCKIINKYANADDYR